MKILVFSASYVALIKLAARVPYDDGMIRFNVNPSEESEEVAAYAVDCASDDQSRTFGLELRPHHIPTLDMPAPAAEIRTPKASDVIRPALTEAEALQLSDEEVVRREYPVRPNPKEALTLLPRGCRW